MFPLRLPPLRWPTLLLLASIALTTLGVLEASRAVRSQRRVAEHALHDYAGFAAWSYQQHLRERLGRATEEVLGAFNHGHDVHRSERIPPVAEVPQYFPYDRRCGCHRLALGPSPVAALAFAIGSDTLGVALNAYPAPSEGWSVDAAVPPSMLALGERLYPPATRAWLNDTITRQVRARRDVGRFPVLVTTHDSAPRFLAYTVMPTIRGDTLVYAVEYDRDAFLSLLRSAMSDSDLLPAAFTRGQPVREIVELQVTDATGRTLFRSDSVSRWALDDTAAVGEAFGAMRVRAQIRPAMADRLIIGGLPRSRLPFLLALLGVAAALSFVAVGQLRREGELARLRADFVASTSHELRTPLAQMRLYLETLRLGRFTTEAQRDRSLENVERETTRLAHLVERVLRFSRAERATAELRQRTDVASALRAICAEFEPLAAARGARLDVACDATPECELEPDALRHVVLNLLDNAVKYGPAGETVRVRLAQAGGHACLTVEDEGPGIPEREREGVWKAYHRGSTARHTAGSGIGLAVVREVVARHGGRAWVEDASSRGARVVVTIPALDATVDPEPARAVGEERPASVEPPPLHARA